MKLSYEDKVQIYELRKQGQSFKQLSKRFGVDVSGLKLHIICSLVLNTSHC
ncbi:Mobile element protein [Streptococcus pneumoniae]|nr:Mobile element protein [Streptococcus pneumoniae]